MDRKRDCGALEKETGWRVITLILVGFVVLAALAVLFVGVVVLVAIREIVIDFRDPKKGNK